MGRLLAFVRDPHPSRNGLKAPPGGGLEGGGGVQGGAIGGGGGQEGRLGGGSRWGDLGLWGGGWHRLPLPPLALPTG